MKTIKIGKHKVEMYDSIEDLPITRFHKYNKMLMIDAGLGSDLTDVDAHIEKVVAFLKEQKTEDAINELFNMRKAIFMVQMNLSPKHLAFAALVTKIDGKEMNDLSDDGLHRVVDALNDVSKKEIVDVMVDSKKKIEDELRTYFPNMFDDSETKEYYNLVKKRTMQTLNAIIEDQGWEEIEKTSREMLTLHKPPKFDGAENIEVASDRNFEKMCIMLSQHMNVDAKKMTTLAFYTANDYLRTQNKKQLK